MNATAFQVHVAVWLGVAAGLFVVASGCDKSSPSSSSDDPSAEQTAERTAEQSAPDASQSPLADLSSETAQRVLAHRDDLARDMIEQSVDRARQLKKMVDHLASNGSEDAVASVRQAYGDVEASILPAFALGEPPSQPARDAWNRLLGSEGLDAISEQTPLLDQLSGSAPPDAGPKGDTGKIDWKGPAGLDAIGGLVVDADISMFGKSNQKTSPDQLRNRRWLQALTDQLLRDLRTLRDHYEKAADSEPGDAVAWLKSGGLERMVEGLVAVSEPEAGPIQRPRQTTPGSVGQRARYIQQGVRALWRGNYRRGDNSTIRGPGLHDLVKPVDATLAERIEQTLSETEKALEAYPTRREPTRDAGPNDGGLSDRVTSALADQREALSAVVETMTKSSDTR